MQRSHAHNRREVCLARPSSILVQCALIIATLLAAAGCEPAASVAAQACHPLGHGKAALLKLKADEFHIADDERRTRFVFELLVCLGNPDPELRDGIAYEAFVALLRGKQLKPAVIQELRASLLQQLQQIENDPLGVRRPFAALVLAEVARADRVDPLFTDQQRAELVSGAVAYMRSIDDYRGYDEQDGWRHAVAHTADLFLQLVLNPAVTRPQLLSIRDAIASQVAPPGAHFYVYGESGRLARPILFMAGRGEFTEKEWADWFATVGSPTPLERWDDVWSSQAGLAKLHNTRAFAQAVFVNVTASDRSNFDALASGALTLLRALP